MQQNDTDTWVYEYGREETSMWERIRTFFAAPVFDGDEDKTRAAALLNPLIFALFVVVVLSALATVFVFAQKLGSGIAVLVVFLVTLAAKLSMQRGHIRLATVLFVTGMWVPVAAMVVLSYARSLFVVAFASLTVVVGLLLGRRASLIVAALSSLTVLVMVIVESLGYTLPDVFPSPLASGWVTLTLSLAMAVAPLNLALRSLNEALTRSRVYATELESQREQLEVLVRERTQDLARRSNYLEATSIVAQQAATITGDLDRLLTRLVRVVSEQFGFYHTGLFLLDARGMWAELRAASSPGGQRMLARGHRLEVGAEGLVGYVAAHGVPRIALDVGEDVTYFDNPDLPETHSEVALPLQIQNEVIGVLDVQSKESQAFSEEDVRVLQSLADQVAVAINNVRLLQQLREAAEAERRARGELTREMWARVLLEESGLEYVSTRGGVFPAGDVLADVDIDIATQVEHTVVDSEDATQLLVPLRSGGQVIGVLKGRKESGWSAEEISIVETLAEQLNAAMERARLYQDTQRRAAREQLVGEVTTRVRASLDLQTVLNTAAAEIREVLGLQDLMIGLAAPGADEDEE